MNSVKALIHVNHLLGTGHAYRAVRIGRALAGRGVSVTLASGNILPETLNTSDLMVRRLPVAKSLDHGFTALAQENGEPIDDQWKERRSRAFYALWEETDPDILITEHFPFGRRKLSFEIKPVLEAMRRSRPDALIAASVRDILVRKVQPEKERQMAAIAAAYYDVVIVHSDPNFVRLEDSFRFVDHIEDLIRYTGFLHSRTEPVPPKSSTAAGEVVVSAGGGAFGLRLLQTALAARTFSENTCNFPWRILAGHNIDEKSFETLRADSPKGVIVERNRSDFTDLLANAALSVSQAGYNSVLDVLAARVPAVLVPSMVNGNEQIERAAILAEHGAVQVVSENDLTEQTLAAAIDKAFLSGSMDMRVATDQGNICAQALLDAFDEKQNRAVAR